MIALPDRAILLGRSLLCNTCIKSSHTSTVPDCAILRGQLENLYNRLAATYSLRFAMLATCVACGSPRCYGDF
jgi:hypothetical protein